MPTRDKLTETQIKSINESRGHCPDCGGDLLEGPCGGCSQNFKCQVCRAEFNLGLTEGLRGSVFVQGQPNVWYGERIDRDDFSFYKKQTLADRWASATDIALTAIARNIVEEEFGEENYEDGWYKGTCVIHSQFGDTPIVWTKIKCGECGSQVYQDLVQKRHRCCNCGYGF